MSKVFSPGKLLLTSEYVVLDGALALAVPTKLGQELSYSELTTKGHQVEWRALHEGELWLHCVIDYEENKVISTNREKEAEFVLKVVGEVKKLSSVRMQHGESYQLWTNLEFPSNYGLGSSSTLMNNLSEWAQIDPFVLNENSLGGSGYDIAVAREKAPLLYQLTSEGRKVEKVNLDFGFKDSLLLVHLGKKQDSREGIKQYRSKRIDPALIEEFSALTWEVLSCDSLNVFEDLMLIHEEKIASFLGIATVKETLFNDVPVFVKSLGAWGGDFVLTRKFEGFEEYFREKGFHTILEWSDLVG